MVALHLVSGSAQIKKKHENIEEYSLDDIEIKGYEFHKAIKMEMRK